MSEQGSYLGAGWFTLPIPKDTIIELMPKFVVTVCCLENGNMPWIWGPFVSQDEANDWIEQHRQRIECLHWVDMNSLGVQELSREW
jgi:hypothetical protein